MAPSAVPRAYSGRVERQPFVPRDLYLHGRWTGWLDLLLSADPSSPLVVGAGRHDLLVRKIPGQVKTVRIGRKRIQHREPDTVEELLVAEIVRRGPEETPVIPGSSFKGALRQVYELLTPSCEPGLGKGRSCFAHPTEARPEVCPACSLFGAMGLAGRVRIQEAEPSEGSSGVKVQIRRVPTPWGRQVPVTGSYRFYDERKAVDRDREPRPEVEATWAVSGEFRTRIRLVNATEDELGLLLASLGIGTSSSTPSIRLGGKKFHGLGGASVRLIAARQVKRERRSWSGEEAERWSENLLARALEREEPRRRAFEELHGVLSIKG